jgi:hypothetical protein
MVGPDRRNMLQDESTSIRSSKLTSCLKDAVVNINLYSPTGKKGIDGLAEMLTDWLGAEAFEDRRRRRSKTETTFATTPEVHMPSWKGSYWLCVYIKRVVMGHLDPNCASILDSMSYEGDGVNARAHGYHSTRGDRALSGL